MTKRSWKFSELQTNLVRAVLTSSPISTIEIEITISELGGSFFQLEFKECMIHIDVKGKKFDFGVAVLPDGAALGSKKLDIDDRFELVDFADTKELIEEVIDTTQRYWSEAQGN